MSLQVWLPLNGDLHNYGLHGESIFTSNNAVSNDNGKIGKCYSFNGTSSYLIADFTPGTIVPNEMSFCCWVKLNNIGKTHTLFCSRPTTGAGLSFFILSSNKLRFDNGNHQSNSANQTTFNYIFTANIWYHIAVIQTSTQKKLYINGILQQSIDKASANLGNNTATKGSVGASGSNDASGNYLDGYLNDVRIYNHALSDKEIEEIAKGLVLHYKLDNIINTNLLENIPKSHSPTEYCGYQLNLKENLIAGQIYTIQLWDVDITHTGKTTSNIGFSVYWGGGSVGLLHRNGSSYYDYYDENSHSVHADYLCFTFTPTEANANHANAANLWLNIYNSVSNANGTRNMHIGAWKLEKGDVATAYGDNNGIVYDSSGYNNNGTIVGDLTTNINNSRYSYSTVFNGTSRIMANSLPVETKTLTCWAKTTKNKSTSQQIVADSNSALTISFYQGTIIGVFGTTRSTGSKSTLGSEYKENDWNFFAVVKTSDDGKRDIYCNGIKLTPTSNDYWGAATGFFIGARNASQGNPFYGEINDVRAYVTALTPEQILELYNTSATIDNQGNVYAREVIE